jgi:alkaline phosphatase D
MFLDFWCKPSNSERRRHAGIYHSVTAGEVGRHIQLIKLDTRTFRDSILPAAGSEFRNDYRPYRDSTVNFLGGGQWALFESVHEEPAELRVVFSSNQFGISCNRFEAWANFLAERSRFAELVNQLELMVLYSSVGMCTMPRSANLIISVAFLYMISRQTESRQLGQIWERIRI